jgi:hypothetical protein
MNVFGLHNISGFIQDLDRFHQVFEIVKFHWLITVKSKSKHSHNLKPMEMTSEFWYSLCRAQIK